MIKNGLPSSYTLHCTHCTRTQGARPHHRSPPTTPPRPPVAGTRQPPRSRLPDTAPALTLPNPAVAAAADCCLIACIVQRRALGGATSSVSDSRRRRCAPARARSASSAPHAACTTHSIRVAITAQERAGTGVFLSLFLLCV
jgi:hypothetical protein